MALEIGGGGETERESSPQWEGDDEEVRREEEASNTASSTGSRSSSSQWENDPYEDDRYGDSAPAYSSPYPTSYVPPRGRTNATDYALQSYVATESYRSSRNVSTVKGRAGIGANDAAPTTERRSVATPSASSGFTGNVAYYSAVDAAQDRQRLANNETRLSLLNAAEANNTNPNNAGTRLDYDMLTAPQPDTGPIAVAKNLAGEAIAKANQFMKNYDEAKQTVWGTEEGQTVQNKLLGEYDIFNQPSDRDNGRMSGPSEWLYNAVTFGNSRGFAPEGSPLNENPGYGDSTSAWALENREEVLEADVQAARERQTEGNYAGAQRSMEAAEYSVYRAGQMVNYESEVLAGNVPEFEDPYSLGLMGDSLNAYRAGIEEARGGADPSLIPGLGEDSLLRTDLSPTAQFVYERTMTANSEPEVVFDSTRGRFDWIGDIPLLGPTLITTRQALGNALNVVEQPWTVAKTTPVQAVPFVGAIDNPGGFSVVQISSAGLDAAQEIIGSNPVQVSWNPNRQIREADMTLPVKIVTTPNSNVPDITLNADLWGRSSAEQAANVVHAAASPLKWAISKLVNETGDVLSERALINNMSAMDYVTDSRVVMNGNVYYGPLTSEQSIPEMVQEGRHVAYMMSASSVDATERAVAATWQAAPLAAAYEEQAREQRMFSALPYPGDDALRAQSALMASQSGATALEYAEFNGWDAVLENESIWRDIGLSMLPFFLGGDPLGLVDRALGAARLFPEQRRIGTAIGDTRKMTDQELTNLNRAQDGKRLSMVNKSLADEEKAIESMAGLGTDGIPFSKAVEMNTHYVRNKMLTGQLLAPTAVSVAQTDAANAHTMFSIFLKDVEYAGDAQKIIAQYLRDPASLATEGLTGFMSPSLRQIEKLGPIKFDSVVASANKEYEGVRNAIALIADEVMQGNPARKMNTADLIVSLDEAVYRASLKIHGALAEEIPIFAAYADNIIIDGQRAIPDPEIAARVTSDDMARYAPGNVADDATPSPSALPDATPSQNYVALRDGTGQVIRLVPAESEDVAKAAARSFQSQIDSVSSAASSNPIRMVGHLQRALVGTAWLGMNPGFWVNNAASAAFHTGVVDRTFTFMKKGQLDNFTDRILSPGVAPTLRTQNRADVAQTIYRKGAGAISDNDIVAQYDEWYKATYPGNVAPSLEIGQSGIKWPSNANKKAFLKESGIVGERNMVASDTAAYVGNASDYMLAEGKGGGVFSALNKIWAGDTNFVGEQNYVRRSSQAAAERAWRLAWPQAIEDGLSDALNSTGMSAIEKQRFISAIIEAGNTGTIDDVMAEVDDMLTKRAANFSVRSLGKDLDGVLSDDSVRAINKFLRDPGTDDLDEIYRQIEEIVKDDQHRWSRMMTDAPKPADVDSMKLDQIRDNAEISEGLKRAGRESGMPQEEVDAIIGDLTSQILQAESRFNDVQRSMLAAGEANGRRLLGAFNKRFEFKMMARSGSDEIFQLYSPIDYSGEEAKTMWNLTFSAKLENWKSYTNNLVAYTDDITERVAEAREDALKFSLFRKLDQAGLISAENLDSAVLEAEGFAKTVDTLFEEGFDAYNGTFETMFADTSDGKKVISEASEPTQLLTDSGEELDWISAAVNNRQDDPAILKVYSRNNDTGIESVYYQYEKTESSMLLAAENAGMGDEAQQIARDVQQKATEEVLLSQLDLVESPELKARISEVLNADMDYLQQTRQIELGRMTAENAELTEAVKEASRLWVDVHSRRMLDIASRHWSSEAFDIVIASERYVDNLSAMVASQITDARNKMLNRQMTANDYEAFRNKSWFDLAEATASRFDLAGYELVKAHAIDMAQQERRWMSRFGEAELIAPAREEGWYTVSINGKAMNMTVSDESGIPQRIVDAYEANPTIKSADLELLASDVLNDSVERNLEQWQAAADALENFDEAYAAFTPIPDAQDYVSKELNSFFASRLDDSEQAPYIAKTYVDFYADEVTMTLGDEATDEQIWDLLSEIPDGDIFNELPEHLQVELVGKVQERLNVENLPRPEPDLGYVDDGTQAVSPAAVTPAPAAPGTATAPAAPASTVMSPDDPGYPSQREIEVRVKLNPEEQAELDAAHPPAHERDMASGYDYGKDRDDRRADKLANQPWTIVKKDITLKDGSTTDGWDLVFTDDVPVDPGLAEWSGIMDELDSGPGAPRYFAGEGQVQRGDVPDAEITRIEDFGPTADGGVGVSGEYEIGDFIENAGETHVPTASGLDTLSSGLMPGEADAWRAKKFPDGAPDLPTFTEAKKPSPAAGVNEQLAPKKGLIRTELGMVDQETGEIMETLGELKAKELSEAQTRAGRAARAAQSIDPERADEILRASQFASPKGTAATISGVARDGSDDLLAGIDNVKRQVYESGNTGTPSIYDYASSSMSKVDSALQRIREDLPSIVQPTPLSLTPNDASTLRKAATDVIYPAHSNAAGAATVAANKMSSFSMISYNNSRFADDILGLFVPYHFWMTRSAKNWMERGMSKPAMAALLAREVRGVERANERDDAPGRYQGRIKVGTGPGGNEYYMMNPLFIGVPRLLQFAQNDFGNENRHRSRLDETITVGRALGFGMYPWTEQMLKYETGQGTDSGYMTWTPQTHMAALGASMYVGGAAFVSGMPDWMPYLTARQLVYQGLDPEKLDQAYSALEDTKVPETLAMLDYLAQESRDLDPLPEIETWRDDAVLEQAWKGASGDRLFMVASGFFGLSTMIRRPEDAVAVEMNEGYFEAGYPENEYGSSLAQETYMDEYPETQLWWAKNQIIEPDKNVPVYPSTGREMVGTEEWVGDGGEEFFDRSADYDQGRPGWTLGLALKDQALDEMNLEMQRNMDKATLEMSLSGADASDINKTLWTIRQYYYGEQTHEPTAYLDLETTFKEEGGVVEAINAEFDWGQYPEQLSGPEYNKYQKLAPTEAAYEVMLDVVTLAEEEFEDLRPRWGSKPQAPQFTVPEEMTFKESQAFWTKQREENQKYKAELLDWKRNEREYDEAVNEMIASALNDLSYLVEVSGGYPMEEEAAQLLIDSLVNEHTALDINPEVLNGILKASAESRIPEKPDYAGITPLPSEDGPGTPYLDLETDFGSNLGEAARLNANDQYATDLTRMVTMEKREDDLNKPAEAFWSDKPFTQRGFWKAYRKNYRNYWRRWNKNRYYRRYRRYGKKRWSRGWRNYRWNSWNNRWPRWVPFQQWDKSFYYPYQNSYENGNGKPSWLNNGVGRRGYDPRSMIPSMMDERIPEAPPVRGWSPEDIERFSGR